MNDTAAEGFTGFTHDALQFLVDLAGNNERFWFQPRKAQYERLLKEPLEALCICLAERFRERGLPLVADPRRSPFRIYRDTRFSRDKSPYKTNIGADFPWSAPSGAEITTNESGRGPHGVGGYFHFSPGEILVGGGIWHPEPPMLAAFRRSVMESPASIHAAIDEPGFVARFGQVSGDRLKRVPTGFPADHPDADLLRLKDVVFGRSLSEAEAFSPKLPDTVADDLAAALPVLRMLAAIRPFTMAPP